MKKLLSLILLLANSAFATSTFDSIVVEGASQFQACAANTVPYIDSGNNLVCSSVTPTELGYLTGVTSSIQTQLSGKESSITAGTSAQYYRGDKSFQTLNTGVVTESSNLYYTNARVDTEFDVRLATKSTSNISEGSNLYYTAARFNTAFAAKSTTDLAEGSNLYYTDARARASQSATSPLAYNSSTGVHACNVASSSQAGCLSSADWSTFNGKEPAISAGTSLQYWRGDKTFQTLNTTAVPESGNLYYTDARVQTLAKNKIVAQEFWVTKDVGNDANDCSIFSPCKTIQAGINAANAVSAYYKQTVVHVAPASGGSGSSYNENITFSQQGVNLICDTPQANTRACLISGTVTVNMTGTSGGANFVAALNESYMSGFVVGTTGSADTLTFSGTLFQRFIATNCYFDNNGTGSTAVVSNSGTTGGTPSALISYDTNWSNNNATNPTVNLSSGARFWMYGTTGTIAQTTNTNKAVIVSGTSASFIANLVQITGQVSVTSNTANVTFNLSTIASGSASCVDTPASPSTGLITMAYAGCTSTNTNTVTGSGVLFTIGSSVLSTSGDIAATVTQAVVQNLPQGEQLLGAGAVKGTNVILSMKNGHIKVTQTTAATATVNANAGTGATCTVANAVDGRGRVTITAGTLPSTGTQCTLNFNKAFGVAPVCMLTPKSAGSAANAVQVQVGTEATGSFPIAFNIVPVATTVYTYNYSCEETQ